MNCQEAQELLGPWFDNELDLVNSLAVEKHLGACARCAAQHERLQALRSAIREHAPYYAAPLHLRVVHGDRRRRMPWLAAAAAVLAAAVLIPRVIMAPGQAMENEVVGAHVRSLLANHLMDVPSTDRHTVKPWFAGKLDFAPDLEGLANRGFTLLGGRLDYLNGRAVAALVYQRRQHTINVFTWPASGDQRVKLDVRKGFNIAHWKRGGMEWWAVSDLAGGELSELAR